MKAISVALVVFSSGLAHAAGFAVDIHSARATAMGTAMKAHVDDASAVLYNPAGLIMGRLLDVQVGDTLIIPSVNLKYANNAGTGTASTESQVIPPPHAYVAYGLNDDISVGIGLFSLYGLVVPWPETWDGRYLSIRSELKTYFINPEAAVRLGDRVRVGAGVQIIRATARLNRALRFSSSAPDGRVEIGGGGWGVGGNVGVMVDIIPRLLSFGATYRSEANLDITGNAHFTNVPAEFQGAIHDQRAQTTVHLPDTFGIGLAYWPIPSLRLAVDLEYNGWQRIGDLTITFPETPPTPPNTLGALDTFLQKKWTHVWNLHVGGEYTLTSQWRLRAGVLYDPTPSPTTTITPDLPDFDRINLCAGVGYRWYNFNFDLGYQFLILMSNTSTAPTFPGTYSGNSSNISITIGYRI